MAYTRPVVYQDEPGRELQRFLDPFLEGKELRTVLDVGCGYSLSVDFPSDVRLVGLDSSAEALAKNRNIDEGIVGDVETYPLPRERFDAVLSWTVLEHLANPRAAIANVTHSLKPGGLLIVGVPNLWSLKGMITKLTPHRFHVWVWRHVLGWEDAGRPGFGPYKTYLRREIAPRRLAELARTQHLEPIYAMTYPSTTRLPRAIRIPWSVAVVLGRVVTLGEWDPDASEHAAVFRKLPSGVHQSDRRDHRVPQPEPRAVGRDQEATARASPA